MKRLIIFDMDGTLLDTSYDIYLSINHALETFGYPNRTLEEIKRFSGDGLYIHLKRSLPKNCDNEVIDRVFKYFFDYYKIHCEDNTAPYSGIVELLTTLKKQSYLTAIVSNKENHTLQQLKQALFGDLIDYAVGAKEGQMPKPAPDPIFYALSYLKIEKQDAIYIGDTEIDYQTAINAGVDVISCLWGFRTKEFLLSIGATKFVEKPIDVLDYLR